MNNKELLGKNARKKLRLEIGFFAYLFHAVYTETMEFPYFYMKVPIPFSYQLIKSPVQPDLCQIWYQLRYWNVLQIVTYFMSLLIIFWF